MTETVGRCSLAKFLAEPKFALGNFEKLLGKYPCRSLFCNKVLRCKRETLNRDASAGVFQIILQNF